MALASRELVAAEAHYHISCYKRYTWDVKTSADTCPTERSSQDIESSAYSKIESDAYSDLFEFLRSDLFSKPRAMPMSSITDHLLKSMNSLSVQDITDSTKKHIKRKLINEFGSSIEIINNVNGKLFVIPDNLSRAELVKENIALSLELNSAKTEDLSSRLKSCASEIRNLVRESTQEQEWPPNPELLDKTYTNIPECLSDVLYSLLSSSKQQTQEGL